MRPSDSSATNSLVKTAWGASTTSSSQCCRPSGQATSLTSYKVCRHLSGSMSDTPLSPFPSFSLCEVVGLPDSAISSPFWAHSSFIFHACKSSLTVFFGTWPSSLISLCLHLQGGLMSSFSFVVFTWTNQSSRILMMTTKLFRRETSL